MEREQIIEHAESLIKETRSVGKGESEASRVKARASEFLRIYAGPRSEFYKDAESATGSPELSSLRIRGILEGFVADIKAGLYEGMNPEHRAQLDTISDYLSQAYVLLQDKRVHAAAPTVLIGATLEEFLRMWVENEGLSLGNRKPSLDAYTMTLREADAITKQDVKDITACAGLRNSAAHGNWEDVADKQRIQMMLENVNLFMRKYEKKAF